jgi:hypothetical protein
MLHRAPGLTLTIGRRQAFVDRGEPPAWHVIEGARDARCAMKEGTRPSARFRTPAWRSGPVVILPAWDGGWPGSCHEHELLTLSGIDQVLDDTEVTTLVDPGFRGLAKARAHWHAPTGDRRTKDQRTTAERAYNRCQAGLRALVEQSIGHLATAWSLRRWRGLLYRARDVFRAAAALIRLGRWLHRLPA